MPVNRPIVTKLTTRLSEEYFANSAQNQDFEWPAKEKLAFNKPIVGFFSKPGHVDVNFILSDGSKTNVNNKTGNEPDCQTVNFDPSQVRKVIINHAGCTFGGI